MPPTSPPHTAAQLAAWLSRRLAEAQTLGHAPHGGGAQVQRLALALDWRDLPANLRADAAFVHRDWGAARHWPTLTLLKSHDGFDRCLTTGPNYALAAALGWREVREIWDEEGVLRGLSALVPEADFATLQVRLETEIGPAEFALAPDSQESPLRVAVMNATGPNLVRQVAAAGVNLYLTGDMRRSALPALEETGTGILALGHRPTELWGLRQLARELRAAFAGLETQVYE